MSYAIAPDVLGGLTVPAFCCSGNQMWRPLEADQDYGSYYWQDGSPIDAAAGLGVCGPDYGASKGRDQAHPTWYPGFSG